MQTGFRVADELDLHAQERAFRGNVKRVWTMTTCKIKGAKTSIKDTWVPATGIGSLKPIIGHARTGVCRRPIVPLTVWEIVANICLKAHNKGNDQGSFGKEFWPKLPRCKGKWIHAVAKELDAPICSERKREQDALVTKCHFGRHNVGKKGRQERLEQESIAVSLARAHTRGCYALQQVLPNRVQRK